MSFAEKIRKQAKTACDICTEVLGEDLECKEDASLFCDDYCEHNKPKWVCVEVAEEAVAELQDEVKRANQARELHLTNFLRIEKEKAKLKQKLQELEEMLKKRPPCATNTAQEMQEWFEGFEKKFRLLLKELEK